MSEHALLNAMVDRDADPVNVEPSFAGQICSISTHLPNRILFLNCPGQLYTFLHSAIRVSYRPGVKSEQGQQILTLNGLPFQAPGPGETFGPQIHCAIVRCMTACGWEIVCSTAISLRVPDIHTFYFRKTKYSVETYTSQPMVCALAFIESNVMRLIDCPVALLELIKVTVEGHWRKGEKSAVKFKVRDSVPELTLKGRVFDATTNNEIIATRTILAQLISKMGAAGYTIITSCQTKVSNAGMRPQELDTWIIRCPDDGNDAAKDGTVPSETFRD